jgi:hypothetical protein
MSEESADSLATIRVRRAGFNHTCTNEGMLCPNATAIRHERDGSLVFCTCRAYAVRMLCVRFDTRGMHAGKPFQPVKTS